MKATPGRPGIACLFIAFALSGGSAAAQSLSITQPSVGDFGSIQLTGSPEHVTAPIDDFVVTDSRAVPTGWNVTVAATRFAEWDPMLNLGLGGYVPSGRKLPEGSLRMVEPTVSNDPPNPPPSITPGPYFIDGTSVKIASASALASSGTFTFTQGGPLRLTVPADAFAGSYRSEITVSINDGP